VYAVLRGRNVRDVPLENPQETTQSSTVSEAVTNRDGLICHTVHSPYQRTETQLQVLLPDGYDHARYLKSGAKLRREHHNYPLVYVLPVAPHLENQWGNPLVELQRLDLHNKHQAICVMPTFSHVPWYANHPTDPTIQQETYLLRSITPFVDHEYAVETRKRHLLGFSKSGWGAYSLLLRNPDRFAKAAAWDSPLGQQTPYKYGMIDIFETQENFERYDVWDLLEAQAERFRDGDERFGLFGYRDFRGHHQATHHHMLRMGIKHLYRDGPKLDHNWGSGWIESAFGFLLS
jgi:S-formylglutathione hydrolase FrmB